MAVNSSDLLSMYVSIPSLNTQQTIVNIINNAIKYTEAGSTIIKAI